MTKTDRRVVKTKDAIHKALLGLMSEKDFDKITIHDIAERANISRGTLYLHYTDKFDLLNQCMDEHLSGTLKLCELAGDEPPDVIRSLLPLFRHFEEHALFYTSMLANAGIQCFHDRLKTMIEQQVGKQINDQAPELDKTVAVQFMASAFVGVVEWWIRNGMPHPAPFMAEQARTIFEHIRFLKSSDRREHE